MMRAIICGSRDWVDAEAIEDVYAVSATEWCGLFKAKGKKK